MAQGCMLSPAPVRGWHGRSAGESREWGTDVGTALLEHSGVMAACEDCLSLAVPRAALEEQWGLFYTVCPSRSSALSTSSFSRHVSNGASGPSFHRRARPH